MNTFTKKLFLLAFVTCVMVYADDKVHPSTLPKYKFPPPTVRPEDIYMTVSSEQEQYARGEPVTIKIALCNKTDKELVIDSFPNMELTVLDPWRKERIIPKTLTVPKEDIIVPEHKPAPVPKTKYMLQNTVWISGRRIHIPSKGKSISRVALNLSFDMTEPPGIYTVIVKCSISQNMQLAFTLEQTIKVEVLHDSVSSSIDLTADYMLRMFGGKKTVDLLCTEAKTLIALLEQKDAREQAKSPDYQRLMMILQATDRAASLGFPDDLRCLEERNQWTLKDFKILVERCRKKMLYR